jgi:hypothetical protein
MRRLGRAASIESLSIAFCSIALLASFAASGEEITPQELLRRMSAAPRDVDFQGPFIYGTTVARMRCASSTRQPRTRAAGQPDRSLTEELLKPRANTGGGLELYMGGPIQTPVR